jgi:uncharacterized protein YbaP (TraB family)
MKKLINILLFIFLSITISFGQSLLVKLSGNGLKKPSYLLGTIHIAYKDTIPVFEKAKSILPICKTYALEVKMDNPLALIGLIDQMKLPNNKTIEDYLTVEEYKKLSVVFQEKTGFKIDLFKSLQPMFIETLLEIDFNNETEKDNKIMMDSDLQSLAKKQKIKIEGLETAAEQLGAISKVSIEEQIYSLKVAIEQKENNNLAYLTTIYLKNNLDELYKWLSENMSVEQKTILLDNRNIIMTDRLIPLIQKNSTLIAVGAGHLGGENGIINLLRKKGYVVEDVQL